MNDTLKMVYRSTENAIIVNEDTGMEIRINPRGIKETLGKGKRYQTLPRELKKLKIATIRSLPDIIKRAELLEDNVENSHGNNPQYAYFYTEVLIDGEKVGIKIDVRKSIETNKFWMHNVQIKKNFDLLSPATTQGSNENQSSFKNNISQNAQNATKKYSDNENDLDIKHSIDIDRYYLEERMEDLAYYIEKKYGYNTYHEKSRISAYS